MQELLADAVVEADALGDVLNVGADFLAEVRHLVDEGDLDGKEGVGGVLDELGCAARCVDQRRLVQEQRTIEFAHDFAGLFAVGADHHAVRALEVADGGALAQEFGVRDDGEFCVRVGLADDVLDLIARANRNCRLGDDDGEAVHVLCDLLGRGVDIRQVGMAIAAARGGPHRDEDGVRVADRVRRVQREGQPAFLDVGTDKLSQSRLEDRHHATLQPVDLARILVHADDCMAEIGKAGSGHQANIACSDHRHAHDALQNCGALPPTQA